MTASPQLLGFKPPHHQSKPIEAKEIAVHEDSVWWVSFWQTVSFLVLREFVNVPLLHY